MHLAADAAGVIDRVEKGDDWLGIVMLKEASGPWWRRLGRASIVARLPFIEQDGRPAGEPALVLAPPLADPVPFEVECHVIEGDGIDLAEGFTVLASAEGSRLVAGPRGVPRAHPAAATAEPAGARSDPRPTSTHRPGGSRARPRGPTTPGASS